MSDKRADTGVKKNRFRYNSTTKWVFENLVSFATHHGYLPSVEELGVLLGMSSKSSVWYHLRRLHDAGFIEIVERKGRAIKVPCLVYDDCRWYDDNMKKRYDDMEKKLDEISMQTRKNRCSQKDRDKTKRTCK